jgi:hypothetical protein
MLMALLLQFNICSIDAVIALRSTMFLDKL